MNDLRANPYLEWGKAGDGQGERLVLLLTIALIMLLGAFVLSTDRGEPARGEHPPSCAGEDAVVVEVVVDAYDLDAGDQRCVHIDQINPTKEP